MTLAPHTRPCRRLTWAGRGVQSVYAIKGRASTKPLAICVADVLDVAVYAHTAHLPRGLLQQLLPGACQHASESCRTSVRLVAVVLRGVVGPVTAGPVTLILTRRADSPLSDELNPGVSGVGACAASSRPYAGFRREVVTAIVAFPTLTRACLLRPRVRQACAFPTLNSSGTWRGDAAWRWR